MSAIFADTSFYIALLNQTDVWHRKARAIGDNLDAPIVVTEYVLAELVLIRLLGARSNPMARMGEMR